ncbi:hypothetical protein O6H91_14G019500 [Diphasiastrum complanatum]|uniref:Uncharacterized protein n=1 Tax=Diphasiastrum complanatum TaxID=34168 RepID=A0ACC2BMZ5_DIPCM|nr:hypothetical protein O6H91_14G019500 [Diphasiastrum complanatum]
MLKSGSVLLLRRALPLRRLLNSRFIATTVSPRIGAIAHERLSPSPTTPPPFRNEIKFFASTPEQDHIEVPLFIPGVVGKYAKALFITAVRSGALETVESELKQVVEAAHNSPTFADFLKDLSVPKEVRVKAVLDIFGETAFSDVTKNFLAVLAENGRLRLLEKMVMAYSEIIMAYKGQVKATITTALELTPQELEGLRTALKGYVKPNQSLVVNQQVDRSIIGGLVIDVEDKHIDLSVENRIRQIEQVIKEAFGEI